MKEEKSKKDEYQKALAVYAEAMKDFRKGKYEKSAETFRSFIEKFPAERDLAARARTYILICGDRLWDPKDTFTPKSAEDHCRLAVFKMNSGADEEALKSVEKALKAAPQSGQALFLQADLLCRAGQLDEALESLGKAIEAETTLRWLAQNEVDFAPLWEDKRFKALTKGA